MRQPSHSCKFGVHLNTGIREYEHFVAHLVDTTPETINTDKPQEWVEYEIPIWLMVNNYIQSSLVHSHVDDTFSMKGLTLHMEKQNSQFSQERDCDENGEVLPISVQIKKIDVIYNPEYEELKEDYRLPIFFKSLSDRNKGATFW